MSRASFYCVCDARYFLGAAGLVNSLRLAGHREPVYVLDCGLTDAQRELIAPHVHLVPAPAAAPPWLLKAVAPLQHPADVMVLIDADIVVTRSLEELLEQAADSKLLVFRNQIDRFAPEWGELLGLGTLRRLPYVSSGLVVAGRPIGDRVLRLMADLQERVDFDQTYWRSNDPAYPFLYADQDVLNAILASRLTPSQTVVLPNRLAPNPPFRGLRPVDGHAPRCTYEDGLEPYALHHHTAKPWLERTYDGVYSQILRRLLAAQDAPIRVPRRDLPLRMRQGLLASAERKRINAGERLRWRLEELRR